MCCQFVTSLLVDALGVVILNFGSQNRFSLLLYHIKNFSNFYESYFVQLSGVAIVMKKFYK